MKRLFHYIAAAAAAMALVLVVTAITPQAGLFVVAPALAQEAAAPASSTAVDFTEIIIAAIGLVGTVLTAVLVAVATKANKWIGQKMGTEQLLQDETVRRYVERGLDRAADYATAKVKGKKITLDLHNELAAIAASYAIRNVPEGLERMGITPDKLVELVQGRVNRLLDNEPEVTGDTS